MLTSPCRRKGPPRRNSGVSFPDGLHNGGHLGIFCRRPRRSIWPQDCLPRLLRPVLAVVCYAPQQQHLPPLPRPHPRRSLWNRSLERLRKLAGRRVQPAHAAGWRAALEQHLQHHDHVQHMRCHCLWHLCRMGRQQDGHGKDALHGVDWVLGLVVPGHLDLLGRKLWIQQPPRVGDRGPAPAGRGDASPAVDVGSAHHSPRPQHYDSRAGLGFL